MRRVRVRCTWKSEHELEVENGTPRFQSDDLDGLIEASGDDVYSNVAELTDWEVIDTLEDNEA